MCRRMRRFYTSDRISALLTVLKIILVLSKNSLYWGLIPFHILNNHLFLIYQSSCSQLIDSSSDIKKDLTYVLVIFYSDHFFFTRFNERMSNTNT